MRQHHHSMHARREGRTRRLLGGQARVLGRSATPEAAAQARAAELQRLGLAEMVRHQAASGEAP